MSMTNCSWNIGIGCKHTGIHFRFSADHALESSRGHLKDQGGQIGMRSIPDGVCNHWPLLIFPYRSLHGFPIAGLFAVPTPRKE